MKLEWAVLGGAALIAGAILLTNRYEMGFRQDGGGFFRLNRLTGEIAVCQPALAGSAGKLPPWQQEAPEARKFYTMCEP